MHSSAELNVISGVPCVRVLLQSAAVLKLETVVLHLTPGGRHEQPVQPPALRPEKIAN